jgi:hypothetical protein
MFTAISPAFTTCYPQCARETLERSVHTEPGSEKALLWIRSAVASHHCRWGGDCRGTATFL